MKSTHHGLDLNAVSMAVGARIYWFLVRPAN